MRREKTENGKAIITGCSDAKYTMSGAILLALVGEFGVPCLFGYFPWMDVLWVLGISVAFLVFLVHWDQFRLEISPDGYRLQHYYLGLIRRSDIWMPPDTTFCIFDPEWDEETDRIALAFISAETRQVVAWLYCFQAWLVEKRLRELAKQYGLRAGNGHFF
jgi:hypothetical protein